MPAKRKSGGNAAQPGPKSSKKKTAVDPNQHSFFNETQDNASTSHAIENSSRLPHASLQPLPQSSVNFWPQVVSKETEETALRVDGSPIPQAYTSSFAQNSSSEIRPKTASHQAGFEFHTASLNDDGTAIETMNYWNGHAPGEEIASTSDQTNRGDGKEERLSFGPNTTECDEDFGDEEDQLPDDFELALEIDDEEEDPSYDEDYKRLDEEDIPAEALVPLSDEDLPFLPLSMQNPQGDTLNATDKFRRLLRDTVESLRSIAKTFNPFKPVPGRRHPFTKAFWGLIQRVRLELLEDMFLDAIPLEVQTLFTLDTWSKEECLGLPPVPLQDSQKEIQGVYVDFVLEDDGAIYAYIGSSNGVLKRIKIGHLSPTSWANHPRSLHYQIFIRDGNTKRANFRFLAAFKKPVENGYLMLLEGMFIVWFQSLRKMNYETPWVCKSAFDTVQTLISQLALPQVPWAGKGLNASWPLRQGFARGATRKKSPCNHCGAMTFPESQRVTAKQAGHPLLADGKRLLADPGNPLGAYLCGACFSDMKRHNGDLRDAEALTARDAQRQAQKLAIEVRVAWKKGDLLIPYLKCQNDDCEYKEYPDSIEKEKLTYSSHAGKIVCHSCRGKLRQKQLNGNSERICARCNAPEAGKMTSFRRGLPHWEKFSKDHLCKTCHSQLIGQYGLPDSSIVCVCCGNQHGMHYNGFYEEAMEGWAYAAGSPLCQGCFQTLKASNGQLPDQSSFVRCAFCPNTKGLNYSGHLFKSRPGWDKAGENICSRCYFRMRIAGESYGKAPVFEARAFIKCTNPGCAQPERRLEKDIRKAPKGWSNAGDILCHACLKFGKLNNGTLPDSRNRTCAKPDCPHKSKYETQKWSSHHWKVCPDSLKEPDSLSDWLCLWCANDARKKAKNQGEPNPVPLTKPKKKS